MGAALVVRLAHHYFRIGILVLRVGVGGFSTYQPPPTRRKVAGRWLRVIVNVVPNCERGWWVVASRDANGNKFYFRLPFFSPRVRNLALNRDFLRRLVCVLKQSGVHAATMQFFPCATTSFMV